MQGNTGGAETVAVTDAPISAKSCRTLRADGPGGKSRRMKLLERMGCFGTGTKNVVIQRAVTVDDLSAAYKLVHDSFVEAGYIFPKPSGLRMRVYEALPDTATFVAEDGNRVVGVNSIVFDSPDLGLPSDNVFHEEINSIRTPGRNLCEVTNWAIAPEYRRTAVLTELIRCYIAHLLASGCEDAVAAISPGHRSFFDLLGYESLGTERSYTQEIYDPVILVRLSLDKLLNRFEQIPDGKEETDLSVLKNYYITNSPYHNQVEHWETTAQKTYKDAVFLRKLFVEQSSLLADSTEEELAAIRRRWGEETYLDVLGHNIIYNTFFEFFRTPLAHNT